MKKRLKMHWTFLVLYLVFAALTIWLQCGGGGG
jgi:hypothetical protein